MLHFNCAYSQTWDVSVQIHSMGLESSLGSNSLINPSITAG